MPKADPGQPEHRMVEYSSAEEYEAKQIDLRTAHDEAGAAARAEAEEGLPTISPERRAELKQAARDMIEERLKARRKARRLMRGGELGR